MSPSALEALRLARLVPSIGWWSAWRAAAKRRVLPLFLLAIRLERENRALIVAFNLKGA